MALSRVWEETSADFLSLADGSLAASFWYVGILFLKSSTQASRFGRSLHSKMVVVRADSRAATIAALQTYLSVSCGNESSEDRMYQHSIEAAEACPGTGFLV